MMNYQIRFETCRADEKLCNKIDYKNCASRWSLTHINPLFMYSSIYYSCSYNLTVFFSVRVRYWMLQQRCVSCGRRLSRFLNRLVFLIGNISVYFAVGTKFLKNTCMKFTFKNVEPLVLLIIRVHVQKPESLLIKIAVKFVCLYA